MIGRNCSWPLLVDQPGPVRFSLARLGFSAHDLVRLLRSYLCGKTAGRDFSLQYCIRPAFCGRVPVDRPGLTRLVGHRLTTDSLSLLRTRLIMKRADTVNLDYDQGFFLEFPLGHLVSGFHYKKNISWWATISYFTRWST